MIYAVDREGKMVDHRAVQAADDGLEKVKKQIEVGTVAQTEFAGSS